jgi:excisionase family DNA binding protein
MMRVSTDARTYPPQWLTVAEAALEVGVSASTVRRWIKEGALPVLQPCEHGAVRVPVRALAARRKEVADGR